MQHIITWTDYWRRDYLNAISEYSHGRTEEGHYIIWLPCGKSWTYNEKMHVYKSLSEVLEG